MSCSYEPAVQPARLDRSSDSRRAAGGIDSIGEIFSEKLAADRMFINLHTRKNGERSVCPPFSSVPHFHPAGSCHYWLPAAVPSDQSATPTKNTRIGGSPFICGSFDEKNQ
jgi:hypothetical protein